MYAICDGCLGVVGGNGIAIRMKVCLSVCPVKPRLAVGHGSNKRLLIKKEVEGSTRDARSTLRRQTSTRFEGGQT